MSGPYSRDMTAEVAAAKLVKRRPTRRQRWTLGVGGGLAGSVPYLSVNLLGFGPSRVGMEVCHCNGRGYGRLDCTVHGLDLVVAAALGSQGGAAAAG